MVYPASPPAGGPEQAVGPGGVVGPQGRVGLAGVIGRSAVPVGGVRVVDQPLASSVTVGSDARSGIGTGWRRVRMDIG